MKPEEYRKHCLLDWRWWRDVWRALHGIDPEAIDARSWPKP
jgi:hypothetical protein